MPGPYVYADVDLLEGLPLVGSHSCVALVQHYANLPHTSTWSAGPVVKGNTTIAKGTAIATFVDGKYPNKAHGNHAAFYISQDATGIRVMDQWAGDKSKPTISSRPLLFKGRNKDGSFKDPSNNADAFFVIQ